MAQQTHRDQHPETAPQRANVSSNGRRQANRSDEQPLRNEANERVGMPAMMQQVPEWRRRHAGVDEIGVGKVRRDDTHSKEKPALRLRRRARERQLRDGGAEEGVREIFHGGNVMLVHRIALQQLAHVPAGNADVLRLWRARDTSRAAPPQTTPFIRTSSKSRVHQPAVAALR